MKFSDIRKAQKESVVDSLTQEGEKIINRAFQTADFNKKRTQNLHDSYGSAVYVDGNIVLNSIRTLDARARVMKRWYNTYKFGQNEIVDYLTSLKPSTKGITLVVSAAMPYASILEEQGGKLTRKYKVLSGARTDMDKLAKQYKSEVILIKR